MTRLDTGKIRLHWEPVALHKLILQVQSMMRSKAAEKRIKLSTELDTDTKEIRLDKSRITQVLVNIFNNAVKFTPVGGTIIAKLYQDPLRPDWVNISIRDTGCGIPEAQLDYIFRRYYQADSSGANQAEGFGLGLYLSQELMKLHGGEIYVKSEPGKGSTFSLSLPVNPAVAERLMMQFPTIVPIIFVTASKDSQLLQRAKDIGAAGFFEKSYEAQELLDAIEEILEE